MNFYFQQKELKKFLYGLFNSFIHKRAGRVSDAGCLPERYEVLKKFIPFAAVLQQQLRFLLSWQSKSAARGYSLRSGKKPKREPQ